MAASNYVYLLTDPRRGNEVFYIGRGVGDRASQHVKDAHKWERDGRQETANPNKLSRILDIETEGFGVGIEILRRDLSVAQAKIVESAAIDLVGLDVLENEVGGHDAQRSSWATHNALAASGIKALDSNIAAIVVGVSGLHGGATALDGFLGADQNDVLANAEKFWKVGPEKRRELTSRCGEELVVLVALQEKTSLVLGIWEVTGLTPEDDKWRFTTADSTSKAIEQLRQRHLLHRIANPANPGQKFTQQVGVRYLNWDTALPVAA